VRNLCRLGNLYVFGNSHLRTICTETTPTQHASTSAVTLDDIPVPQVRSPVIHFNRLLIFYRQVPSGRFDFVVPDPLAWDLIPDTPGKLDGPGEMFSFAFKEHTHNKPN
jgi:hypothetical protein